MELELSVKCFSPIPSNNRLYDIGKNRKGGVWLYLIKEVKNFRAESLIQINKQINSIAEFEGYDKDQFYEVHMTFWIQEKNFMSRDLNNMIKAIEDTVKEGIKVDDSRALRSAFEKCINDIDSFEYIGIRIIPISGQPKRLSEVIDHES